MAGKCKVEGCGKHASRIGLCWSHCKEVGIDPKTGGKLPVVSLAAERVLDHVEKAAKVQVKEVVERTGLAICGDCGLTPCACFDEDWHPWPPDVAPVGFGLVTNVDGAQVPFGTDAVIVLALREAWAEKEAAWLVELSGLKPGQTIMRAVQMIDALEHLGY